MCDGENEGEEGLATSWKMGMRARKRGDKDTSAPGSHALSSWSLHTPFYKKGIRGLESEIRECVQATQLEIVR